MLSGDNGLLKRAGNARDDTVVGQEKEQVELEYVSAAVKKLGDEVDEEALGIELNSSVGNGKTTVSTNDDSTLNVYFTDTEHNYTVENGNVTIAKKRMPIVTIPPTTAVTENTKYKDTNNDIAVIPTGFRVSDNTDEQVIDTGLVVYDGNDNEWVWIPVEDVNNLYDTITETELSGNTGITTTKASKSEIITDIKRGIPGSTIRREPDILSQEDNNSYAQVAGFNDLFDMATSLAKDYQNMILSVELYKGFYVGRYELVGSETNPREKSGPTLSNKNWYTFYKICKLFTVDEVVESRMIWGCQWDAILKWMLSSNDDDVKSFVTNSSGKGNFSSNFVNTGSNIDYQVNKIYDLGRQLYRMDSRS